MNRQKKQDNIKRHEIKFAFTNKDENKLLQNYKLKKIFPDRIVESVYYDTSEFKFFHLSEEGVTPRIKIRMRGYNNGLLENLEIKKTNNYDRQKIVIKKFNYNLTDFYKNLKNLGIEGAFVKKLKVKYKRSYYQFENVGRITFDQDIVFSLPGNINSLIKTNHKVMEVKVNSDYFDKSKIEKVVNLKESRFSKYCIGVNYLYNN
tara:strand:- start:804 stop:1415 length:612 start_codon:yes stop_codon:yes gene_type:complete